MLVFELFIIFFEFWMFELVKSVISINIEGLGTIDLVFEGPLLIAFIHLKIKAGKKIRRIKVISANRKFIFPIVVAK